MSDTQILRKNASVAFRKQRSKYRGRLTGAMFAASLLQGSGPVNAACPVAPAAVVEVPGIAYYTDTRHSVRDPALFEANRQALAPLDRYLAQIARMSDAYLGGDASAAECTLVWLTGWAKQGALLGEPTSGPQARSQRRWAAAAMALSALKVWEMAAERDRGVLRPYFRRIASAAEEDAATDKLRNNLLYWVGVVDIAVARLAAEPRLAERAIGICRDAIRSLTPQGSLPLEDRRGDRAIDYNGFALFPLSVIATLYGDHERGCSVADLHPLAQYILDHRARTSDKFLRWAPFVGINVGIAPQALFYSYGGGSLDLVAKKLTAIARTGPT